VDLSKNQNVMLDVFGSPYALKDVDISNVSTVLVSYENNDDSMKATASGILGQTKISGRLPVLVNDNLKFGMGMDVEAKIQNQTDRKNSSETKNSKIVME